MTTGTATPQDSQPGIESPTHPLPGSDARERGAAVVSDEASGPLHQATQSLLAAELDDALGGFLAAAAEALHSEGASILIIDKHSEELFFAAAHGEKAAELRKLRLRAVEGVAGRCLNEGKTLIVNQAAEDDGFASQIDEKTKFATRQILAIPLHFGGTTMGVLEFVNKKVGSFSSSDSFAGEILANCASIAIWHSRRYAREMSELALDKAETQARTPMIGKSKALDKVRKLVPRLAKSDAPILIGGESGTGKEVLARVLWKASKRSRRTFVAVNCAAIPATLIESELFGHEKGSFTGAHQRRIGKFEAADKGTLFLDEIGELPLELQAKMLRVLQEMEVMRIGATKPVKVDVRVIAATNRDLKAAAEKKEFREDLFYRLNVLSVDLPPLRERKEDITLLAEYFISQFNGSMGRAIERISDDLAARFEAHDWPGNVRELRNVIERLMVLNDGTELVGDGWKTE